MRGIFNSPFLLEYLNRLPCAMLWKLGFQKKLELSEVHDASKFVLC